MAEVGRHAVVPVKVRAKIEIEPPSLAVVGRWLVIAVVIWFALLIIVCTTIGMLKEYL